MIPHQLNILRTIRVNIHSFYSYSFIDHIGVTMASIRCNSCQTEKDHSEFLRNPLNLQGKLLKKCSTCRARGRASKKRVAENSLPAQPSKGYRTLAPSEVPLQPADQYMAQMQSDDVLRLIYNLGTWLCSGQGY